MLVNTARGAIVDQDALAHALHAARSPARRSTSPTPSRSRPTTRSSTPPTSSSSPTSARPPTPPASAWPTSRSTTSSPASPAAAPPPGRVGSAPHARRRRGHRNQLHPPADRRRRGRRGVRRARAALEVTRLGQGVDAPAGSPTRPMERVYARARRSTASDRASTAPRPRSRVLTSAVRDADQRRGVHRGACASATASTPARSTATRRRASRSSAPRSERDPRRRRRTLVVIDIGGGSTELVVGARGEMRLPRLHPAGVVRQTERHIHRDPPRAGGAGGPRRRGARRSSRRAARGRARDRRGRRRRRGHRHLVRGDRRRSSTPTTPSASTGYALDARRLEELLARLAAMPTGRAPRRSRGLHPDRAPTIVAGRRSCSRRCAPSGSTRSRSPSTTSCAGARLCGS